MSRESMLARIRAAVAAGNGDGPVVVPRAYRHAGTLAPGSDSVVELLADRLVDYRAEIRRVERPGLVAAVAELVGAAGRVVIADGLPDDVRTGLAATTATVVVDGDPAPLTPAELDAVDLVVTTAAVAIAVSGTIVLDGGAGQGRRAISLVPDRHLVVLRADQVVQTVPEGLARLDPVRPLTMIAGPSATSDIELSRVEGVHGPRTLQVIVVGD